MQDFWFFFKYTSYTYKTEIQKAEIAIMQAVFFLSHLFLGMTDMLRRGWYVWACMNP